MLSSCETELPRHYGRRRAHVEKTGTRGAGSMFDAPTRFARPNNSIPALVYQELKQLARAKDGIGTIRSWRPPAHGGDKEADDQDGAVDLMAQPQRPNSPLAVEGNVKPLRVVQPPAFGASRIEGGRCDRRAEKEPPIADRDQGHGTGSVTCHRPSSRISKAFHLPKRTAHVHLWTSMATKTLKASAHRHAIVVKLTGSTCRTVWPRGVNIAPR